jgi:hypothetical protein
LVVARPSSRFWLGRGLATKNGATSAANSSLRNGEPTNTSTTTTAGFLAFAISTTGRRSGTMQNMAQLNIDALIEKATSALDHYETKFAREATEKAPTTDDEAPQETEGQRTSKYNPRNYNQKKPEPTTTAPVVTPVGAVSVPSRGRKWTDEDYRMRRQKTPAERQAEGRRHLHADVSGATFETLRATAAKLGVTLGEALDTLLAP